MRSNSSASATAPLPFEEETQTPANWKQEVASRVAERRARQQQTAHVVDVRSPAQPAADAERSARAARIAAAVAARYAEAPLFSEARPQTQDASTAPAPVATQFAQLAEEPVSSPQNSAPAFEEPAPDDDHVNFSLLDSAPMAQQEITHEDPAIEDVFAESMVVPQQALPANLIHFPREIVAARRARPRLTERAKSLDESSGLAAQVQLRIFEVDAATAANPTTAQPETPQTNTRPVLQADVTAPNLQDAIYLDAQAQPNAFEEYPAALAVAPLPVASAGSRAMAMAVDFTLVTGAFFLFLFVFALTSPQLPTGSLAWGAGAVIYGALWLLYQGMFFSLGYATPGMRYARIAFCTLEDSNPTHAMLLRRIPAWCVSALPLGLGFLWAALDEDGLCWHDRISGLFLRSY